MFGVWIIRRAMRDRAHEGQIVYFVLVVDRGRPNTIDDGASRELRKRPAQLPSSYG